uniref:Cholesterol 7-desaturase n=1 Tax=Rhabditophanes sp. KR3021 TaxID=114890 RepID=A0AC35U5L9_9BILA
MDITFFYIFLIGVLVSWFHIYASLGLLILFGIYWIATIPVNRIVRVGELGYYFGEEKHSDRIKDRLVARVARLRIKGDLPPVFPNGWFCIADSRDLKKGTIQPITFNGEQLSLVRSHSGEAFLIDSYCPHLGANFNIGGKVINDNCVQCPFHGWVFNAETGKCVNIPYDDGSIPEKAKVTTWVIAEKNTSIFVWYHADGYAPTWEIPDILEVQEGDWVFQGRTEHEILCHPQEIPENGADIAHLNYLHLHGVQEGNNVTRIPMNNLKPTIQHYWNGKWEAEAEPNAHIGAMELDQHMLFNNYIIPFTSTKLKAVQLGPGIVQMMFDFGIFGKGVVFQYVTSEEPMFQRVRFTLYAKVPRWYAKFVLIAEANQFERDIFIWANKKYIKNPLYVKNDGPIHKHRRWFSKFYTENSPTLNKDGSVSHRAKSVLDCQLPTITLHDGHVTLYENLLQTEYRGVVQPGKPYTIDIYLSQSENTDYVIESCVFNNRTTFITQNGCMKIDGIFIDKWETTNYGTPGSIKRTIIHFVAPESSIRVHCLLRLIQCCSCAEKSCEQPLKYRDFPYTPYQLVMSHPKATLLPLPGQGLKAPSDLIPMTPQLQVPIQRNSSKTIWEEWWFWLVIILAFLLFCCIPCLIGICCYFKKRKNDKKKVTIFKKDHQGCLTTEDNKSVGKVSIINDTKHTLNMNNNPTGGYHHNHHNPTNLDPNMLKRNSYISQSSGSFINDDFETSMSVTRAARIVNNPHSTQPFHRPPGQIPEHIVNSVRNHLASSSNHPQFSPVRQELNNYSEITLKKGINLPPLNHNQHQQTLRRTEVSRQLGNESMFI